MGGQCICQRPRWPPLALTLALACVSIPTAVCATSDFPNPTPEGNSWAPCSFAVDQIAAEGNGTAYGSCLACNPTSATCPPKCQSLIDALYKQCDGVFAPQDHFFDPAGTLNGVFNDHIDVLRVAAQRCGCSDARSLRWTAGVGVVVAALASVLLAGG